MLTPTLPRSRTTASSARRLWWFAPYIALSAVHVIALATGSTAVAEPTKLTLMPLLVLAVVGAAGRAVPRAPFALLIIALVFSWLGDGAATFFPFAPTIPMMLACFGLAHLAYIVLFLRHLGRGRLPVWSALYAVWWIGLLVVLWPALGTLAIPVAVYGLVLGATAVTATRGSPAIALGAVFFLASDSILAFQLFLPEAAPAWTSPLVMLTYTLGQGLIAAGAVTTLRQRTRA